MKQQFISKFQKHEIFNQKSPQERIFFFLPFGQLFIFIKLKNFSSWCKSHVQEIIMQKKKSLFIYKNPFGHFIHFYL